MLSIQIAKFNLILLCIFIACTCMCLWRLQGQRSEFQSRLCEVQEKNGRLQEEMKEIEEENRDLKELVDLTEKERNVRLCN